MRTFFNGIRMGMREILAHPARSFLTMLGIILGVTALVSTISIVAGMFRYAEEQLKEAGGLEKLIIEEEEPPAYQQEIKRYSRGLTLDDVEVLRETVRGIDIVAPELNEYRYIARAEGNEYRSRLKGVTPDYFPLNRYDVVEGRALVPEDVTAAAQVVVLGENGASTLFPGRLSVVGETILIGRVPFEVIGRLKNYEMEGSSRIGSSGGRNSLRWKNRGMFIPITTMQKRFPMKDDEMLGRVDSISVRLLDLDQMNDVVAQINNALTASHGGILDFQVATNEEGVAQVREQRKTYYTAMGGVAGISLVVGGIGIMNVMLASISERIREIGIRKAVGATNANVFLQVLAEAVTLSLLGGLIGMLTSVLCVDLLAGLLENSPLEPSVSVEALTVGFVFSVVVGVASGLYPAIKAARLDPIDALRYE